MNKESSIMRRCPICGSGFLENLENGNFICSHCENILSECSVCNGYGYYSASWKQDSEYDFENCQTCHGTGFILIKKENR